MNMQEMNRTHTVQNPCQGEYKKVLCVCTAGLLRSPTAAYVLSLPPFNFNTRSAGASDDLALIKLDDVLLSWADEIVCMDEGHYETVLNILSQIELKNKPNVLCLGIPNNYFYRQKELRDLIVERYKQRASI